MRICVGQAGSPRTLDQTRRSSLGLGLSGSCQGLTGTWLGPDGL